MHEISFTILDTEEGQYPLTDFGERLHRCLSARNCRVIRIDRSLPGQVFVVGKVKGKQAALELADHVAVCIGNRCPVVIEVVDPRLQQHPVLLRTIVPPQLDTTAGG